MLTEVRFESGEYLYLLLAVPVVVYLWNVALRRARRVRRELFRSDTDRGGLRRTSNLSRPGLRALRQWGFTLVLVVLIAAVARPRILRERIQENLVGIDVVIVMDLSYSMRAEDIVPSRMEKAKEVVRNFIVRKQDEDRVGLVAFGETSLILSYLTEDPDNLLFYLDFMEPAYGTNIGRAIKAGLTVYERDSEWQAQRGTSREAARRHRFMILVSDGEDHGSELEEALMEAAEEKIKVHAVGIGSRRAVPIPVATEASGVRTHLRDGRGRPVYTQFREDSAREVARRTGARFYRAVAGPELAHAFDEILRREKLLAGVEVKREYQDLYPYLLLGSLAMFLALIAVDRD